MEEIKRFVLNKQLSEVETLLSSYDYRIVKEDDNVMSFPYDFNPVRLNLETKLGLIVNVTVG